MSVPGIRQSNSDTIAGNLLPCPHLLSRQGLCGTHSQPRSAWTRALCNSRRVRARIPLSGPQSAAATSAPNRSCAISRMLLPAKYPSRAIENFPIPVPRRLVPRQCSIPPEPLLISRAYQSARTLDRRAALPMRGPRQPLERAPGDHSRPSPVRQSLRRRSLPARPRAIRISIITQFRERHGPSDVQLSERAENTMPAPISR